MRSFLIVIMTSVMFTAAAAMEKSALSVELKFDNQSYRLNEPVPVVISVVNNTGAPARFVLSQLVYETFFFQLRTPKNENVDLIDTFSVSIKENASAASYNREVVLENGESFSRRIDITEWFDLRESGYYYIKGLFYPNPDIKNEFHESFDYKLLIKPPLLVENSLVQASVSNRAVLEAKKFLPPYEVVSDMLDAKMKKDWERFLLHFDAERLIQAFDTYNKAYQQARTGRYRLEIVRDFQNYLTTYWSDRIIRYETVESTVKQDRATVVCDVEYKVRTTSYLHRYEFYLYRSVDNQWLIYNYVVLKAR